jgi:hypothetical protein
MRRTVVLLLAALLVGACGADPATGAVPSTGGATDPSALAFAAPLVGGGTLDARTLADKPTVFWFWAPG